MKKGRLSRKDNCGPWIAHLPCTMLLKYLHKILTGVSCVPVMTTSHPVVNECHYPIHAVYATRYNHLPNSLPPTHNRAARLRLHAFFFQPFVDKAGDKPCPKIVRFVHSRTYLSRINCFRSPLTDLTLPLPNPKLYSY